MLMYNFISTLALSMFLLLNLGAAPPRTIPPELWAEYTLNGQIPVYSWYFDDTYSTPKFFSYEMIITYIQKALRRENNYYGDTDAQLYRALDDLAAEIKGKEVGIIGSFLPWYESIILSYGAIPVVIEYNPVTTNFPGITYLTPAQYQANPRKFDLILSISSTEHDGLGRYGDPLDPNGDLKSMDTFKQMLNPGGKLILAVPIGQDAIIWNAHRKYGPIRLKMLLQGWKPVKYYGYNHLLLEAHPDTHYQPILVLEPK